MPSFELPDLQFLSTFGKENYRTKMYLNSFTGKSTSSVSNLLDCLIWQFLTEALFFTVSLTKEAG